jgi:hypothetical protein
MPVCPKCRNRYEGDVDAPCPYCGHEPAGLSLEFEESGPLDGRPEESEAEGEGEVPLGLTEEPAAGGGPVRPDVVRCADCGAAFLGQTAEPCPKCRSTRTAPYGQVPAPAPAGPVPTGEVTCPACGVGYDTAQSAVCPRCGVPAPEAGEGEGGTPLLRCTACGAVFMGRPGDACPKCGASVGEREGLPWQNRKAKDLSVVASVWRTVTAVHAHPRAAFVELKRGRGYTEPIVYQVILNLVILVGTYPVQLLMQHLGVAPFRAVPGFGMGQPVFDFGLFTLMHFGMGILGIPIGILMTIFFAWVFNRLIVSLGGERLWVSDTYCVFAYGTTSAGLWNLIPVCGAFIGLVWALVIWLGGMSGLHRVSAWRALAALVLFIVLMVALVVGLAVGCSAFVMLLSSL